MKRWIDRHPEAQPLGVAYSIPASILCVSGAGIPPVAVPPGPHPGAGTAPHPDQMGPLPGWYAIFVGQLRARHRNYEYFGYFEPVATVGYTVYVYHISEDEADGVRRELGLPPVAAGPPFDDES